MDGEDRSEHVIVSVMIGGVSIARLLKSMTNESKSSIIKFNVAALLGWDNQAASASLP